MNDYKIELGTQLNTKGLKEDVAKLDDKYKVKLGIDLKVNDIKKRIGDYNKNTNNAKLHLKVKLDTDDIKKQINKLNLSGASGGKGVTMTVDTTSLEDSLKEVKGLVTDIKTSLGTLDSKSGMKDFLSSINQIATALGKAENESDSLVKSLSALSKKDFSINIGVNMGKRNNNMIAYGRAARKQVVPELEKQIKELENLFGGQQATMSKLTKQGKNVGFDVFTDFADFNSDSAIKKMEAMEKYINSLKKLATIDNVNLDGFNEIHKDASALINDITGIENAIDKVGDAPEKLKNLFGGSIDGEGLSKQLDIIVVDLGEIRTALQGLSSGVSLEGLTQSFNRLSETLEKLVSNAKLVQSVLGDSLGGSASIDTGAINKVEKISDNSTAAIIQNEKKKQEAYKATAETVMYHAGIVSKLNKAETNGRFYGSNRGTGYFGTGHYFVDSATKHELDNDSHYNKLPYTSIDISKYDNLFKATTDEVAGKLHTFLSNLTAFTQGSDSYDVSELFAQFKSVFGDTIMDVKEFGSKLDQLKVFMSKSSLDDRSDSVPTQFMKSLGYEGVDTRGTRYADTRYGTVIYDLKEESILQANITDELQKQGQMLEKINYAKGQVFDKGEDERIQGILDQQAKKREIAEEFQNTFDTTSLNKANSDLDTAQSRLKEIDGIIFDLQKGIDNAEQDVQRFAREMAEFGIDMSDEEIKDSTQRRVEDYKESIGELTREKEELQSRIPALEETYNRETQLANEARERARQTVEQRHQEAQQAQESANVVVQAEEKKQQAIKETAKETSQLLEYFRKYNAIDKANAPEDSIYHNMDVDSTSLKNAEYHRNQIIKQLTSENGIGKITSLGSIDDGEISQRNLEYFSAMNAELEKLGYTLGEIKANSDNSVLSADIIPIDENAVKDAEEMRNILFGVESQQEKVAQSASDVANTIVQAEEKKQQAYRETADAYERISKDTSLVRDDANFQKTFEKSNQAAQEAQRHFQELLADEKAVVSVTEQFDDSNALQSFVVNIRRASGEVETLRYAMDKLNDEGNEGFVYRGSSASDSRVEKQLEAHIKKANDLQIKLDKIKSGYDDMGASKPIKDDNHIKSLEEQYKKVQAAIENVKNADNTAYASMVSNAEKEKAALENMVREFRNAENVATSLRSKDISTVKDTYASKLDVLISKMRKDGVYSSGFEKGAENLRSVLSNATDSSGLTRFLNGLDKLEAGYKRASASAKEFNQSQKVGINVSGLESKIADLQRISPQIDKFETEIDGAKVSVQSLLNDLKQINTQGDFSVVNSRFKAFVDSAKAAGITVAETSKKVKSIGDIKFDFKSGKFDNDVSKIHEKLNRLSNASDELCDSIRAVDAAYEKLDTASKLDTDDITNAKKLTDTYEAYVKVLKTANNELDIQARKETAQARSQKLEQDKKTLKLNTLNWMNENTRAAKEYGTELKKLISLIDKVDDVGLKDVGRQIKNVQKTAQVMGKTGLTVFDKLKAKAKEYMTYLSAAELFMYAEQALRSMFEQVKLIDSAMTELKKVTDETDASYEKFLTNAASRAKEIGTTIDGLVSSTADFAKLGYGFEESQGLAEVANIYAVVGDEIEGVEGATQSLVSTMAAFKDEMNGMSNSDFAMNIIDKFNEIGELIA